MVGFLLQADAISARKQQFDDWVGEQQRNAQQAAQAAQRAAQEAAQRAATELQARQSVIQSALAAAAPVTPPEPPPTPEPVYAPSTPVYTTPEAQQRAQAFDGWVSQRQALEDLLANATPPGRAHGGGFTAPEPTGVGDFFSELGTRAARTVERFGEATAPGREMTAQGSAELTPILRENFPNITQPKHPAAVFAEMHEKYPGQVPGEVDTSAMTPEDRRRWEDAQLFVGGMSLSSTGGTNIARQAGSALDRFSPMAAARGVGAAAGGVAGYATTPEEAGPVERIGRTLGGVGIGLAAPGVVEAAVTRPSIQQDILESLRRGGVVTDPLTSSTRPNLTGDFVDVTKQLMLTNPIGRAADVVGNTIELLRQPLFLTMGGRGPEAAAGLAALGRAIPEAAQNASDVLFRGQQAATLGQGASQTRGRDFIFRILGAGDMFTRTLGEYQGMASKAVSMLDDAGLERGTPQAEQYLAQHADELYREGARSGTTSVFGSAQRGDHAGAIDQLMSRFGDFKESKLNSPSKVDQAVGALLDLQIPFSGTPSRVWQVAIQRVPGITQAAGVARIANALQKQDKFAASKALGELTLESMVQAQIAQGIRQGFITGPNDPEHPSSVQVAGQWTPLSRFGVYGTPMNIMATFAESWQKTGREIDPETTDRFGAALNASMAPLAEALPGFSMVQALSGLGRGGLTGALTDTAADAVTRLISPAFLGFAENMADPVVRDIATRGPQQLWEPAFARNVLLAHFLPPKLDPTTGEPRERTFSLLGGAEKPSSPVRAELARLKRMGYDLNPPEDRPQSITVRGVNVPVKNGTPEQRAMVEARGQELAKLGEQMGKPSYAKMSDDQKAKFWARMLDRSARVQARAWTENVDPEKAADILARGKRVVGRVRDVEDEDELINRQVAIMTQIRREQERRRRADEDAFESRTAAPRRSPFG